MRSDAGAEKLSHWQPSKKHVGFQQLVANEMDLLTTVVSIGHGRLCNNFLERIVGNDEHPWGYRPDNLHR